MVLKHDVVLFEKLRELRKSIAHAKKVPPYIVFGDRTLQQMARCHPQNRDSFSRIFGVGKAKLEEYSDEFLRVIREHAELPQLQDHSIAQAPEREHKSARGLSQTYAQTMNLLRQGLSLEEVARRRGLAKSTVIGHIERCVEVGEELDISPWLPSPERRLRIEAAFRETESMLLGKMRERLGDDYSYEELRLVRVSQTQKRKGQSEVTGPAAVSHGGVTGESAHKCGHVPVEGSQSLIKSRPASTDLQHTASKGGAQRGKIETNLLALRERAARALRHSFGADDGYWPTFQEIGADLKVSGEQVRQIAQTAMSKMRLSSRLHRSKSVAEPSTTSSCDSQASVNGTHALGYPSGEPEQASGYIQAVRKSHPRAYEPWSSSEEQQLVSLFESGLSIDRIAAALERRPSAVRTRLNRLGLT